MDAPAAAPLADDFSFRVQWHDDAGCPAATPGPPPERVDVVVVGAGYTGLAAAAELARLGATVAVLDRDRLGDGASTRNGGMVIPELKAPPHDLRAQYGTLGDRLWDDVLTAFAWTEAEAGAADCHYARAGQVYLGHRPSKVEALRAQAAAGAAEGEPVRFVEGDDLAAEIGSSVYAGGLLIERSGALQPARWHAHLARRALAAGAVVHDRCAVVGCQSHAGGWRVYTTAGPIDAAEVVVATNGVTDGAFEALRRGVVPVGSFIIATEPLGDDLAASVSPNGRIFVDSRNFLSYWRLTPDGRMAFGGRHSMREPTLAEARDALYARMVATHPQLGGVRVSAVWGGKVALTLDRLPHCGRRDGLWYATGCNGTGVSLLPWMGMRLAATIAGTGTLPAFARLPLPAVPLWPLRAVTTRVVGAALAAEDRGVLAVPGRLLPH